MTCFLLFGYFFPLEIFISIHFILLIFLIHSHYNFVSNCFRFSINHTKKNKKQKAEGEESRIAALQQNQQKNLNELLSVSVWRWYSYICGSRMFHSVACKWFSWLKWNLKKKKIEETREWMNCRCLRMN